MEKKITQDIYNEIEQLVDCALDAKTKKDAEPYLKKLNYLHWSEGYGGYTNILFGELIASVQRASGSISDKEKLCRFARTCLYKLSGQIGTATEN